MSLLRLSPFHAVWRSQESIMRTRIHLATFLASMSLLAACGGSGGGGAAPSPVQFTYGALGGSVAANDFRRTVGDAFVGSDGMFMTDVETKVHGLRPEPSMQTGAHTTEADGAIVVSIDGIDLFRGFRSDNGEVMILGTRGETGAQPGISVLIRRAPELQTADLEGVFRTASMEYESTDQILTAWTRNVGFGAITPFTEPAVTNRDGRVSTSLRSPRETDRHTIEDGEVSFSMFDFYRGGMSADRELIWASGSSSRTNPLSAWNGAVAMVRVADSASDATFSGRYGFVYLERNSNSYISSTGVLEADGVGGIQFETIQINWEGARFSRDVSAQASSAVSNTGALSLFITPSESFLGGISQSGRYAVLAGNTNDGSPPGIWILVRLAQ